MSPDQRLLAYAVDFTGGERHELRVRDLEYRSRSRRRRPRHLLRPRLGERRRDALLRQARRRRAAPSGVAAHARDLDRRRRPRVRGPRRALLRERRAHPHRTLRPPLLRLEDDERGVVRRRRLADRPRPVSSRHRESGLEYSVDHHVPVLARRHRRPVPRAHQRRRRRELQAPGHLRRRGRIARTGPTSSRTAPTCASKTSTRSPGTSCSRSARTASSDSASSTSPTRTRSHVIEMPDPVFSVWSGANLEFDTTTLRYDYTSLVLPVSSYDYDLDDRESTLVKRQQVLGGYDPSAYTSARLWATADRRDPDPDLGGAPQRRPARRHRTRRALRLRLVRGLDRTVVLVGPAQPPRPRLRVRDRAHPRRRRDGPRLVRGRRLANKAHTFTDFIASAETLIDAGYTSPADSRHAARAPAGC